MGGGSSLTGTDVLHLHMSCLEMESISRASGFVSVACIALHDGIHFKSFRICFCPMCSTSLPKLCNQSQWSKHRHSTGAWMVSSSSGVKARFLGLLVIEASDEKYADWPAYWKWKWWKASHYFVHHDHLFMQWDCHELQSTYRSTSVPVLDKTVTPLSALPSSLP
jgi:hypothetical protein